MAANKYITGDLRGERVAEFIACRTLRHAWDPIGAGDRRPEFGALVCLRCIRCGTLRYDKFSRVSGERIGNPQYVHPDGYRDAEGHDMSWWRATWAAEVVDDQLVMEPEVPIRKRAAARKRA